MNPESYIKKLESLRGQRVTVFSNSCEFRIEGNLHGGEMPAQPFGVGVNGSEGSAEVTIRPEDITSLQILPHQTIIDIN